MIATPYVRNTRTSPNALEIAVSKGGGVVIVHTWALKSWYGKP